MSEHVRRYSDFGLPLPVLDDGRDQGLVLGTSVCASPTCPATRLHLTCAPATRSGRHLDVRWDEASAAAWDVETEALEGDVGPRVAGFLADHADVLRERWRRLVAQRTDRLYPLRAAPAWRPGDTIGYDDLFPGAFTLRLRVGDEWWAIYDSHCPDPACACTDVILHAGRPDGSVLMVKGTLGISRPTEAGGRAERQLWKDVGADRELVAVLRERRAKVRAAGSFVRGERYEAIRRAAPPLSPSPAVDADGYLQGGRVPASWIARLFEATRTLDAFGYDSEMRAVVTGDRDLELDLLVSGGELELCEPGSEAGWLCLDLLPQRSIRDAHRRQRLAHGWPLIRGHLLPALLEEIGEDDWDQPSRESVALATAVAEALAQHVPDLDGGASGAFGARIELGDVNLEIELHVPDFELEAGEPPEGAADGVPGDEDGFDEDDVDEQDFDDDEDGDEPQPSSLEGMLGAFEDWCLQTGVDFEEASATTHVVESIDQHCASHLDGADWRSTHAWGAYLEELAPRKVSIPDEEIDLVPRGLARFVGWLEAVGHLDRREAKRLRATLERSGPRFVARMRDPRYFGMAKSVFADIQASGVDLSDAAAVQRYIAEIDARGAAGFAAPPGAPSARSRSGGSRERSPHRWHPSPGEPVPAPKDPCPCGSGRRYKKCCMPR